MRPLTSFSRRAYADRVGSHCRFFRTTTGLVAVQAMNSPHEAGHRTVILHCPGVTVHDLEKTLRLPLLLALSFTAGVAPAGAEQEVKDLCEMLDEVAKYIGS
ncbi:hypothetical protein [Arthrobacter cheniae]|uniref:hypothetical protein n=1 Tax=Arthrobacter cheniae TaxID=1258888 RepID=UPI0011C3A2A9|nr:hypothetical protein [Arthrobacter cheniae]